MSGPGGIGGNRPTNNIASYPSTSPNSRLDVNDPELNEHGRFVAEQQAQAKTVALAGGPQRTAQAQPPGKSFTETMGAAFTAMGAAVTSFLRGLGDRIATIEMPSLPRISLRRQEAVQAEAAAPQRPADPFEAAMGGKPVSAKVRADFTAFALVASALRHDYAAIIDHILALPEGNAVAKANDALATRKADQPNLQVMKALRSEEGLSLSHLVSNFVKSGAEQELNLFHIKGLVASIVDINGKLNELGLKDAVVRQVPNENGPGFSLQVSSPRGAVDGEAIDLLRQMEVQVDKLANSVHNEMSNQLKSRQGGGLMDDIGQQPEQLLFKAGLAAVAEGAAAVGNKAASSQAEIGKLNAMSTSEFAQALRADPSLARHLPQMTASSSARQEYENFVASQPPMSRQAAVEGFHEMVRQSLIDAFLVKGGMTPEEPADNVEAAPDFSNIPGMGTTGAAPAGAASGLPQVALASLGHLFNLRGNNLTPEQMNRLDAQCNKEFSFELMPFLRSGAALMNIQAADGSTRPMHAKTLEAGETVILTADLPVIKQWAAHFVAEGSERQVNVKGPHRKALESALSNMPDDAAAATDAQKQALAGAMGDCFTEIATMVQKDVFRRAFPDASFMT